MKTPAVLLIALACVGFGMSQEGKTVPVEQEPSHHKIIENEYTRVFSVEVAPGKQTLQHEHKNDYVYVTLGDSDVLHIPAGKEPVELKLKDGEARFSKAPLVHVAKDIAKTPFRNVTIEILSQQDAGMDHAKNEPVTDNGFTYRVLIDNEKVRVTDVVLAPGASITMHTHKLPHLSVAVTGYELADDKGHTARATVGTTRFTPAGVSHSLKNIGANTAHLVTIDFK